MRNLLITSLLAIVLVVLSALAALPATTATQTLTYEVAAIDDIEVSGSPQPLIIDTALAGSEPTCATDSSTTYTITTNGGSNSRKITAQLDSDMPDGLTLCITLAGPAGADTPPSKVTLTTTPTNAVTSIDSVAESGLTITYELSATIAAGVVDSATKTVTLTITASP